MNCLCGILFTGPKAENHQRGYCLRHVPLVRQDVDAMRARTQRYLALQGAQVEGRAGRGYIRTVDTLT